MKIRFCRSVYLAGDYVTIWWQANIDVTDGVIKKLIIADILGYRPSLLNLLERIKLLSSFSTRLIQIIYHSYRHKKLSKITCARYNYNLNFINILSSSPIKKI